jgi:hypothetical protein
VADDSKNERGTPWVDAAGKFALPLVTAIVALAGTYLTTTINEQNNLRDTINQREQAESELRTQMFRELVSPVVGADLGMGAENRPARLALLAELLALNFHEHFELGPLMLYVDELADQTTVNRQRLRSISRRVISRQLAVLGPPTTARKGAQCLDERTDVDIWLMSDGSDVTGAPQTCQIMAGDDKKTATFMCSNMTPEQEQSAEILPPFTVSSLDCQDRLTLLFADLDWPRNTVRVLATSTPSTALGRESAAAADTSIAEFVEFTLSPYAMPFSDNTLLRSGNRFGLYLRQSEPSREPCTPPVCDPTLRLMRLSLIWFPRNFIPPRERPTDFEEIRNALNL